MLAKLRVPLTSRDEGSKCVWMTSRAISGRPDGAVAVVAHFVHSAPLAARHFETFPKAVAQIARAARLAEMELSFTQVRSPISTSKTDET